MLVKIRGLRIEKYWGDSVSGHNCEFIYTSKIKDRYVVLASSDDQKYLISFTTEEGECGSGWTTATWASCHVIGVDSFNGYTHRVIKPTEVELDDFSKEDFKNELVDFSECGEDHYYPCGSFYIDMSIFKETGRELDKKPMWVFYGDSATGKSYVASHLGLEVYETDSSPELPDLLQYEVIVLGNKYPFTLEQLQKRISEDCVVKFVNFHN